MPDEFCELCELPLSTCVHGMPPPPADAAPATRAPSARLARVPGSSRPSPNAPPIPAKGPAKAPAKTATKAPARVSKVTAPEAFRSPILAVLAGSESALETDEVMALLDQEMDDILLERDRQATPGGEIRWHAAARKARKAMIDEGLVTAPSPGLWQLTEQGAAEAE